MKLFVIALFAALFAFAADAPKPKTETPPVLTAEDREPLHEAEEALQADQTNAALGQAAEARIPERQKARDAAVKVIRDKCGAYGFVRDEAGRINCGKTKPPEPKMPTPIAKDEVKK